MAGFLQIRGKMPISLCRSQKILKSALKIKKKYNFFYVAINKLTLELNASLNTARSN